MARECCKYGAEERSIEVLVVKPEEKRPLAKQMCRWKENNNKDFLVVGWSNLFHNRDMWWALMKVVMNFRVP
jgi:hypothetical protein